MIVARKSLKTLLDHGPFNNDGRSTCDDTDDFFEGLEDLRKYLSRLTNRLSFRQARLAVGVAITLGMFFAFIQIRADLADERERIASLGEQALVPGLGSMSRAAYRLDDVAADELAMGILEEPSILTVRIADDFGGTLAELSKPRPNENSSIFGFLISNAPIISTLELVVQPENLHVGQVEVVVDPLVAARSFFRRTTLILASGFANSLALTFALTLLFYWTVTRRIEQMATRFRTTSVGTQSEPDGDELDALDQTISDWRAQREVANLEIAAAAERMRLAAQSAQLGIWEWDLRDNSLLWDEGMYALYGADPATFGNSFDAWTLFLHPDDQEIAFEMLKEAVDGTGRINRNFRIVRPDGEIATLRGVAKTVCDASGHRIKMIGVSINVSEEERLRAELETMQRVESLGALSAGVAHDFNNVLAVIMGNLELAAQEEKMEDAKDYISTALHACLQGKGLTMQLLAFGKKSQLTPQPTDANVIMQKLLPMLSRTIPATIEIKQSLAQDLPAIRVDRALFEATILNLVINARDAMEDGGEILFATSQIDIDATMTDLQMGRLPPGRYVRIVVEDTGPGIPPELLPRVFEPFFSTKKFGAGHGMGLSMVRGFAEQSGGIARIGPETGVGTSVELYFPALGADISAGNDPDTQTAPALVDRKTILVVEDNPNVRRMTVLQLKHLGHATIEAGNASEALSVLSSGAIVDLVLTDAVMPGEPQGVELARQLSVCADAPPVIVMSGYDGSIALGNSFEPIGFDFLLKPLSICELKAALARAFT